MRQGGKLFLVRSHFAIEEFLKVTDVNHTDQLGLAIHGGAGKCTEPFVD